MMHEKGKPAGTAEGGIAMRSLLGIILVLFTAVFGVIMAIGYIGTGPGPETQTQDPGDVQSEEITEVHFEYDEFSGEQYRLDVWVESITEDGADAQIEKRIGPMNENGRSREGTIRMSAEEVDRLMAILGRYDLEMFSQRPTESANTLPVRVLSVFYGDRMVSVDWNSEYPKTVGPDEDIMYYEAFNFFEELIDKEPGWEDVRRDLPKEEDHRDNPDIYESTVSWFGHEVSLVPGTGDGSEDGWGAQIDYGEKDWWLKEGFTGSWSMTEEDREQEHSTDSEVLLAVSKDGNVMLRTDDEVWTGQLPEIRYYKNEIWVGLKNANLNERAFAISYQNEDYSHLHISAYPGPFPEEQFLPTDVYVTKNMQ